MNSAAQDIGQPMRLLVLTNNTQRPSFRQRIEIYLDFLQQNDIHCDVESFPHSSLACRRLFGKARQYDAVFLQKKRLNAWNGYWLRRYSRMIIYDFDDAIMYDNKDSQHGAATREKRFARTVTLADHVIAGNNYLAEHARRHNPNVHVIPTGLDVDQYNVTREKPTDGQTRLVWIGSRSTLPYLESLKDILDEIGRRHDNVTLRIICDAFFDLQNMHVEKIPWSLQTQAADLTTCDIGLAPLPDDPFTRGKCGFKILQYAAAALPTVASPVGVNGSYIRPGKNGFLPETPPQWLDHLSYLIENSSTRAQMGQNARANVKTHFDLAVLADQLCCHLRKCLNS